MKLDILFTSYITLIIAISIQQPSISYYGTRPMGMGGAFTAIADDSNAAYWNPAGFAMNPGVEMSGSSLPTNRNSVMGDNLLSAKFCYDAPMASPFEWIFGIGFLSGLAIDTAQYLGDLGVLKKNWGRDVKRTNREDSMAQQVKEKGADVVRSINPFKGNVPKTGIEQRRFIGPLNLYFDLTPQRHSYWRNRSKYADDEDSPLNKAQFALGLTWMYDNNPTLDEKRNWYSISFASGWEERIAVGGNLNLYDLQLISSGIRGFGFGIDLGAIAKPLPAFSIGLTAKEILTSDIKWQNGATTRYEMLINGGVAIDPIDRLTLAADIHNIFAQNSGQATMHYGAEFRPVNGMAFRGGLFDGSKTAGISIGTGAFVIDYAYLGGVFNRTQMVGITYKF